MGHENWSTGPVVAWDSSASHASRTAAGSVFFPNERMLHPNGHSAMHGPSLDHATHRQPVSQQLPHNEWRRIAATVVSQNPVSPKKSVLKDQKGLIIVSLFFVFSGIIIIGVSRTNGFDPAVQHSVFLVGAMIAFMGLSVFFLMLSFAFLCHKIHSDKIRCASSSAKGHVSERA